MYVGKRQGVGADVPGSQRQSGMRHGRQLAPGAEALAGGDGSGNVHSHVGTGDMGIRFAMLRACNGVVEQGFCLGYRASERVAGELTARH
uniref:Uncharacterized protein n=1 Tax=Plectus sambesii TaxID=2011161 RepID=A0A914WR69_9BILA